MASAPLDAGQMLSFNVADARFALPASAVREVVRRPTVTRVPHAPASLLGLGNLRGTVVPVVSLGALIGKPVGAGGRVIVLEQADPVGILVDEVSTVTGRGGEDEARPIDLPALLCEAFGTERAARPASIGSLGATLREEAAAEDIVLLAFWVSGQEYALPLDQIEEVTRLPDDITLLPRADAAVVGSVARAGKLLPLLSLQALLGLKQRETGQRPRIVIARIGTHKVGLVVDSVSAILRVDESRIDPVPAVLSRGSSEARIQAICRFDGDKRLVSILATDHLVRDDVTSKLLQASDGEGADMASEAESADTEQFLVFRLGDQAFGLPIAVVSEVTTLPAKLTPLPKAPAFIEGVMNLRGQVLPVIDQRRRFLGDAASGKRRRVVVVSLGDIQAGFVVDAVSEVLRVPANALRTAPELGNDETRVFDRVANLDSGMILIVEPRELLDRAERDMLAAMASEDAPPP
ncbi:chemotaxis protein CheW [Sphingomonas floccifaciens]|uniref:Chemotaxis protein CheW n=1 Tax=Sphingomonas floccifaciens TaxID=1844115 RepID=A0ABW4NDG8_9SPHN